MEFQDRILRCVDCGTEFVWTAGEQQFFADKNFKNEPKRCKACKAKRASSTGWTRLRPRARGNRHRCVRPCGKETTVPFRPTQGRPVFCKRMLPGPEVCRSGEVCSGCCAKLTRGLIRSIFHANCGEGRRRCRGSGREGPDHSRRRRRSTRRTKSIRSSARDRRRSS